MLAAHPRETTELRPFLPGTEVQTRTRLVHLLNLGTTSLARHVTQLEFCKPTSQRRMGVCSHAHASCTRMHGSVNPRFHGLTDWSSC